MNDEDAFTGFVVPFFDVVIKGGMGGAAAVSACAYGEEAGGFIDDDDVTVFMNDV